MVAAELLPCDAIRRIEAAASASLPRGTLMARAAEAVAEATAVLARSLEARRPIVALLGPGNNGGDALLAALRLRDFGFATRAVALRPEVDPSGDAGAVWRRARDLGFPIEPVSSLLSMSTAARQAPHNAAHDRAAAPILIDGLFGIGLTRPLDGLAASVCQAVCEAGWPVVSVDVPSGIDADTGRLVGGPAGTAMRARATVTMIADKPGLHTGAALDHVGLLSVSSLGIDVSTRNHALATYARADIGRLFGMCDAVGVLPSRRRRDSNKGDHGSVLCFGGAPGMRGAALLAARAAQAMGAGKVFVGTPIGEIFDPGQPQLMTAAAEVPFDRYSVLAIGCGLGDSTLAFSSVARALDEARRLVLDADALNCIAADASLTKALRRRASDAGCILTPHPLEAARLLGSDVSAVQEDRRGAALALARRFQAVALLKGAGTLVATPDGRWSVIDTATPALASAGTGDVLTGMIAALLARSVTASDAARLAAWLHGRAAQDWEAAMGHDEGLSAAELPRLARTALGTLMRMRETTR